MINNNRYTKFFKARKEDESLIQEIAKLHYSQEALKELNPLEMTPMAALNKIFELKEMVKK